MPLRFLETRIHLRSPICVLQRPHCATSKQPPPRNKGGQRLRAPDCSGVTIRGWNLALSIQNRNKYTCRGVYTKDQRARLSPGEPIIWREPRTFPPWPASGPFPRVPQPATFSRTRFSQRARYFCVFPVCKDSRPTAILSVRRRVAGRL